MTDRYCKKCGITPHEQTGSVVKGDERTDEFSCMKCGMVFYAVKWA